MNIVYSYGKILNNNSNDSLINNFLNQIKLNEKNKNFLLLLNFDLKKKIISHSFFEITPNNEAEIAEKYVWVGNTRDTTNRYLTTNNVDRYFLGLDRKIIKKSKEKNENKLTSLKKTKIPLIHLVKKYNDNKSEFFLKLNLIFETFYSSEFNYSLDITKLDSFNSYLDLTFKLIQDYKTEKEQKSKNEIFKNISKNLILFDTDIVLEIIISTNDFNSLKEMFINKLKYYLTIDYDETDKKNKNSLSKYFDLFLKIFNKTKKELVLITLLFNNEPLVQDQTYIKILEKEFLGDQDIENEKRQNLINCSYCNIKKSDIRIDLLKGSKIKFFNTDKSIFASQVNSNNFNLNLSICSACFKDIAVGERFLLNYFSVFWANTNLLIIPGIFPFINLNYDDLNNLKELSLDLNKGVYESQKIDELTLFEDNMENLLDLLKENFLSFNYIFFESDKGGRPNKIANMITDIPPTRLLEINKAETALAGEDCIKPPSITNLRNIYFNIPVKIDKKTSLSIGKKYTLNLFDAILTKKTINLNQLIDKFVKTIKIIYFEEEGFNIKIKTNNLNFKLLEMNSIIQFLSLIDVIKEFYALEENYIMSDEIFSLINVELRNEIEKYWNNKETYKVSESKGLFLLGILIYSIGIKQRNDDLKGDPFLNKINFNGIREDKILNLIVEVEKKLRDYKIIGLNEPILANVNHLIERSRNNWKLTPTENVFYIMSGFSFFPFYLNKNKKKNNSKKEKLNNE